jgi:hypothetical protein
VITTLQAFRWAKAAAKMKLDLWGLEYFDPFLVHFPIALAYVDLKNPRIVMLNHAEHAIPRDMGCHGRIGRGTCKEYRPQVGTAQKYTLNIC